MASDRDCNKFSPCFLQAELEPERLWLREEDVKIGKLGQFLEEERWRNPGLKMRLTPLRMWKKPKEGEDVEERLADRCKTLTVTSANCNHRQL